MTTPSDMAKISDRRNSSATCSTVGDQDTAPTKQAPKSQRTVGRRTHIIFNEVTRIEGTKNPSTKRHKVRCNHCGAELEGRRETLATHFQRVCPDITDQDRQRIFSGMPAGLDKFTESAKMPHPMGPMEYNRPHMYSPYYYPSQRPVPPQRSPPTYNTSYYQPVQSRYEYSASSSPSFPPTQPSYYSERSYYSPRLSPAENKTHSFSVGSLMSRPEPPRSHEDVMPNRKRSYPYGEESVMSPAVRHAPERPSVYPTYASVSSGYVTAPSSAPSSPKVSRAPAADIWGDRLNTLEDFVDRQYISAEDADALRPLIFNKDDRLNIIYLGYEKQPAEFRNHHRLTRGLTSLLDEMKHNRPGFTPISMDSRDPTTLETPSPSSSPALQ